MPAKRPRPNRQGLTLLEIMVTMVLLVLVVTSFAVIYPSGFRLHRKSRLSTTAAQTARSVLNELKSLPLTSEDGGLSLAYLASNGYSAQDPLWDDFPRTKFPTGFRLDSSDGVSATLYDLAGGTDPSVYATLRVSILYDAPHGNRNEPIRLTLVAGKSWNR